jgi:LysM repeat protein
MTRGKWAALILAFALASLAAAILANGSDLKVEFTQPAPGSTVTQDKIEVVLSVSPADRNLARVELLADGKAHDSLKLGGKPHEKVKLTWNTLDFSTGQHTLSIKLIDSEGSVAEAQAQFTLERPKPSPTPPSAPVAAPPAPAQERPGVKIVRPAVNAELAGAVEIAIEVQSPGGASVVFLLVDGRHVFISNVSPYLFTWDTTKWPNGSHSLVAKASSQQGTEGTSQAVSVTVNNPGGRTEMQPPPRPGVGGAAAAPAAPTEAGPAPVSPAENAAAPVAPPQVAAAASQPHPESAPVAPGVSAQPSSSVQAVAPEQPATRVQPSTVPAQPKKQAAPIAPAPAKQPAASAAKAQPQPTAASAPLRVAAAPPKATSIPAAITAQPARKVAPASQAAQPQPPAARVQPPTVPAQPKKQAAPIAPAPARQPAASAAKAQPQPTAVSAPLRLAAAPAKREAVAIQGPSSKPSRQLSPARQAPSGQISPEVHVVTPGQGLYAIARLYGIPVKELASINGLQMDSRLAVGQKLLLPAPVPILFVSGKQVESDVAPALHDSVLFGPLRHIVASAGGQTEWESEHGGGTATAHLEREKLSVSIGSKTAIFNGSKIALTIAPYLEKGRTMVPIRLLQRLFGWAIHYNASARRADITAKQA